MKKLANGSQSLYLDIYYNGRRSYEFLKLYLNPELTPQIKQLNAETLNAANTIKMQRILEINRGEAGLKKISLRAKIPLREWLKTYAANMERRGARCLEVIRSTMLLVAKYNDNIALRDIDRKYCLGFIDFLQNEYISKRGTHLKPKSADTYAGCLRNALNAAVRDEIIPENPFKKLSENEKIKVPESKRDFLTQEEIRQLIDTECPHEEVKRAFLFGCFCGLRYGDISRLRWGDINKDVGQWRVSVVMHKTEKPNYLPLSESAFQWLPERGEAQDTDIVFGTLPRISSIERILKKWAKAAGITKNVSFHVSRHTFATLMLTLGADLYTTSKLLGHSNVKTTQIYAKIVDSKKVEAVNLLDAAFK